jgi:hypothetical protein
MSVRIPVDLNGLKGVYIVTRLVPSFLSFSYSFNAERVHVTKSAVEVLTLLLFITNILFNSGPIHAKIKFSRRHSVLVHEFS